MPSEVSWMFPGRIAHVRFYGAVALDDIQDQIRQIRPMLVEGVAPIHFLVDVSGVENYSFTLVQFRALLPPQDPKAGWTVVFGPNRLLRLFGSILMQIVRGKVRFCDSYEDAMSFLKMVDPSLSDLTQDSSR